MKAMRKIVSVVLALIMVMAMSSTAFAAKISVDENDSRSYDVYQIFTGDVSADGNTLSNVEWGKNAADKNADVETALAALVAVNGQADTDELAVIEQYVDLNSEKAGTVSAGKPLDGVASGYYLLVDKGTVGNGEAYSLYVVKIVGDIVVAPKRGTTEVAKSVKDVNDSTGAAAWGTTADYDMGDAVPFKLTATLADNVSSYDTYKVVFHDTLDAALTYNGDAKVMFGNTDVTEYFTIANNGTSLTISCDNVKSFGAADSSVITVDYTAELVKADTIKTEGYENKVYLEYSNNPNTGQEGSVGTTPEKVVTVYTYQVVVNKIDKATKDALAGAGFTLYKNVNGTYVKVGEEITGVTTFTWTGLDDGAYKLVETTTPDGYNTIDDVEFDITAETDGMPADTTEYFAANGGVLSADVENGKGFILPTTGGMGTTILYLVGGLMVIGAGAVLVMKRRRAEEN